MNYRAFYFKLPSTMVLLFSISIGGCATHSCPKTNCPQLTPPKRTIDNCEKLKPEQPEKSVDNSENVNPMIEMCKNRNRWILQGDYNGYFLINHNLTDFEEREIANTMINEIIARKFVDIKDGIILTILNGRKPHQPDATIEWEWFSKKSFNTKLTIIKNSKKVSVPVSSADPGNKPTRRDMLYNSFTFSMESLFKNNDDTYLIISTELQPEIYVGAAVDNGYGAVGLSGTIRDGHPSYTFVLVKHLEKWSLHSIYHSNDVDICTDLLSNNREIPYFIEDPEWARQNETENK